MSNVMKCQVSWNVKCHETSNIMKSQMSWNAKCHETSDVMKHQMSWNVKKFLSFFNVKSLETSNVMKYLMSLESPSHHPWLSTNTCRYFCRWSEIGAGNGALRPLTLHCSVWAEGHRQSVSTEAEVVWAVVLTEPRKPTNNSQLAGVIRITSNLWFPSERKSPFLPLQCALLWASSNFRQDTTKDGHALVFCINKNF